MADRPLAPSPVIKIKTNNLLSRTLKPDAPTCPAGPAGSLPRRDPTSTCDPAAVSVDGAGESRVVEVAIEIHGDGVVLDEEVSPPGDDVVVFIVNEEGGFGCHR
ncbi:hypothetical protein VM1G_07686 [Cytospora mali]|uniref:Uncharacterized protein n=1 Tax=Cytospora mali TaxID=578113 RepID=A0A194W7Z2_CYTMA|nr:hypothetical protein VM1G_07686 [Valsa mali]